MGTNIQIFLNKNTLTLGIVCEQRKNQEDLYCTTTIFITFAHEPLKIISYENTHHWRNRHHQ